MSFAYRARRVAAVFLKNSRRTIREVANEIKISKSSVHRHVTSQKKRVATVGGYQLIPGQNCPLNNQLLCHYFLLSVWYDNFFPLICIGVAKMSFAYRARRVAAVFLKNSRRTIREVANEIKISKSSVHRHVTSQKKRVATVGHRFFETEEGYQFLRRLLMAVVLIFGIQSGVGADTISSFFTAILLTEYIASSASCIRDFETKMRLLISHFGDEMMEKVLTLCQNKELHLGGDESFFGKDIFLVLMELQSGFIFTEELVKDRKHKTWSSVTEPCLSKLNNILSVAMDKGRSLLALGKNIKSAITTMDLYHLLQDITRAFGAQFSAKQRSLDKQQKTTEQNKSLSVEKKSLAIEAISTQRQTFDEGENTYKKSLFSLSTMCHPFMGIAEPQSSSTLHRKMMGVISTLRKVMSACGISDKRNLIDRCERRLGLLTILNDYWHQWVLAAVQAKTFELKEQRWATKYLLPWCYWQWQYSKAKRKPEQREYYQKQVEGAYQHLLSSPLTAQYLTEDWKSWGTSMAMKYQRTTSAVEGRNGRLSYHYFSSKGVRASHVKPLTVIHNFWIKRSDNSTACERLCHFKPPDLFEWMLERMDAIPVARPRQPSIATA